jgi:hypothetical protein
MLLLKEKTQTCFWRICLEAKSFWKRHLFLNATFPNDVSDGVQR